MEWSFNQVVAHNLRRVRESRGMTQTAACQATRSFMPGGGWTPAVWSAAERSVRGTRIRKFDADELAAIAAGLGVSIVALVLPPNPDENPVTTIKGEGAESGWSISDTFALATTVDDHSKAEIDQLVGALGIESSDASLTSIETSASQRRIQAVIDGLTELAASASELLVLPRNR